MTSTTEPAAHKAHKTHKAHETHRTHRTHKVIDVASVVGRYLAVWSETDPEARRGAVAGLWAADGVEFVEGVRFRGHDELGARVAEACAAFVESGTYDVTTANDATRHDDIVTFTIQLVARGGATPGELAWAARVFLLLDADGLIREDYQLTVKPLAA